MGTDFMKAKAKRFTKGLDRGLVELTRSNFFSRMPQALEVTAVAKSVGDSCLSKGDKVVLHAHDGRLFVEVGTTICAEIIKPQEKWLTELQDAGGYANAVIALAHPSLSLVEVSLHQSI
jgi:hypothetical protein